MKLIIYLLHLLIFSNNEALILRKRFLVKFVGKFRL